MTAATPILPKADAAELVVAARIRRGLTWAAIADRIGAPVVWTTAALLGQHPLSPVQAQAVRDLLGLDETVAESLRRQPSRGSDPERAGRRARPGTPARRRRGPPR